MKIFSSVSVINTFIACIADPNLSPSQEKLTLKRMIDFVKDRGDENMREINRKLQRMLEETLTKNMHLQKVTLPLYLSSFICLFHYLPELSNLLPQKFNTETELVSSIFVVLR